MDQDTNCGEGMYRDTPEEKEISRLEQRLSQAKLEEKIAKAKLELLTVHVRIGFSELAQILREEAGACRQTFIELQKSPEICHSFEAIEAVLFSLAGRLDDRYAAAFALVAIEAQQAAEGFAPGRTP